MVFSVSVALLDTTKGPKNLEIGFMLPNRSAGARGVGKSGISNPISFSLVPGRRILFFPPWFDGLKNTKFRLPIPVVYWPEKRHFRPPHPSGMLVLASMPRV